MREKEAKKLVKNLKAGFKKIRTYATFVQIPFI